MIEVVSPKNNMHHKIQGMNLDKMADFLHKTACNDCVVKADQNYPEQLQRCQTSKEINCKQCIKRYLDMELT